MGFFIPETMKKIDNWVLWKHDAGKKIPYSAKYNGKAAVNNPRQWADYSSAMLKLENTDNYNGLGFVFSNGCGLVFIDIDNCINTDGELNGFASEIVNLFKGNYIEYSQSGKGLHIVCKGKIDAAYKGAEIEIYSSGRYMAVTGEPYEPSEPQLSQIQLNELCKRFKREDKHIKNHTDADLRFDDETIMKKAIRGRNGSVFRELYAGNWQTRYETQSNADMRLIAILWYYSRNAEQVKRIFLTSGLGQREKARRDDYIYRTIQRAADNTHTDAYRSEQRNRSMQEKAPKKRNYRKRAHW